MKIAFSFLLAFVLLQLSASAKDYYSVKNGEATDRSTWNSSRNGNGTAPAGFNDPSDNFIVQDGFNVTGNSFYCNGSVIVENGGIYSTGNKGNITNITTMVSVNEGGIFSLSKQTTLLAGFVLVQGTLENLGGEIRLDPMAASRRMAVSFH